MSFNKKNSVFIHHVLSYFLCSEHQVVNLELGLHKDVSWLKDSSYLLNCRSLYGASRNWLASNAEYVCLLLTLRRCQCLKAIQRRNVG